MSADDAALALHDRATQGAVLSREEQAQLEQWYAAQDTSEQIMLSGVAAPSTIPDLQTQVAAVLERCVALAQHIQELSNYNDSLRWDVANLRQQVARLLQPA